MSELTQIKNNAITLTNEVSANDDNKINMIDKSIDGLKYSLDMCNNPNRGI